jgi:FtsZ-interacting cell division protein ZipA
METITAAVMIIVGLIAIILMIVSVIYPEWFTHRNKPMASVMAPVVRNEIKKNREELNEP